MWAWGVPGGWGFGFGWFPGRGGAAFASAAAVGAIATDAVAIIGWALPGFGVGMALYFAAMGAGRMRWPVLAALMRVALAVLGGALLMDVAGLGLLGQCFSVGVGLRAYGAICGLGARDVVLQAGLGGD